MAAPQYPGFPNISLHPILILQISCNTRDQNPSFPVASILWQHLKHVYGTFGPHFVSVARPKMNVLAKSTWKTCFVELPVTTLHVQSDPERQEAKLKATTFLKSHSNASVVMMVDAHTFNHDGTVTLDNEKSAPLSIVGHTGFLGSRRCTYILYPSSLLMPLA